MKLSDYKKHLGKPLIIGVFLTALVAGSIFFWWAKRPERLYKPCALPPLEKYLEAGDKSAPLLHALGVNLKYLEKKRDIPSCPVNGFSMDPDLLKATTMHLISTIKETVPAGASGGVHDLMALEVNGGVLVTGYYLPEFEASKQPTLRFSTPIYGVPPDLITVRLKDFTNDPALKHLILRGKVHGNRLIPYYTRAELEKALDLPIIAYLESPVEHLILQIQGSGILIYPDGVMSYVHYAADNGFPYRSVGKILIEKGMLSRANADWPAIRDWFEENPEKFKAVVNKNPRFIFFKEEPHVRQAIGAQGMPLTPFHSVAVDPSALPFGGVFYLEVPIPGHGTLKTLVVAQDKGAAIKGRNRIDLYMGRGERAGRIAGTLKARGRLVLLVAKYP